jgi:hypothetical protein
MQGDDGLQLQRRIIAFGSKEKPVPYDDAKGFCDRKMALHLMQTGFAIPKKALHLMQRDFAIEKRLCT